MMCAFYHSRASDRMEISDYDDDFIASLEIFSHLDFSSRNIDPNYHLCVEESINILRSQQQTNSVPNINGNMIMAKDFYSECWDKKGRLRIAIGKRQYETYYKIFPWFAYDLMLRQNKDSFREGVPCDTGPRLTEALNYFRNRSYNDDDLQQLRCYFLAFEQTFGKTIKVVSLILQLYHLCITPSSSGGNLDIACFIVSYSFNLGPIHVTVPSPSLNCAALDGDYYPTSPSINDDTMSPLGSSKKSNSIDLEDIVDRVACLEFKEEIQKSELQGLKERMGRIEEIQNNGHDVNQHAIKRPREGCDRANWVKIRPDDYPTKNEWCLPGRVFGLYGDGIGPLRSKKIGGPIWHDVRVYSAKPDIIEAHKDPGNPDQYAPVVMVCI